MSYQQYPVSVSIWDRPVLMNGGSMKCTGAPQRYAPYPPIHRVQQCPRPAVQYPCSLFSAPGLSSSSYSHVPGDPRGADPADPAAPHLQHFWHRLPGGVVAQLGQYGVGSHDCLLRAPKELRARILMDVAGGPHAAWFDALLQQDTPDFFNILRLPLSSPGQRHAIHLESLLRPREPVSTRRAGPTPSSNMKLLQAASRQGLNIRSACDRIADSRAGASVRESSANTYDSHLRQIQRACQVLGEPAFPASLDTIRRVSSLVGHPTTLRGWLAAWRRLHHSARLPWPADRDPFLVAIQAGLRRNLGPAPPRARCRRALLRHILVAASASQSWAAGAFAVLAYTFGLRAPSELVKQATAQSFRVSPNQISFGPFRRKGAAELQTLQRWCCCRQDRLLCPHDWLEIICESRPAGCLFPHEPMIYMGAIQGIIRSLGIHDASMYTSHCFRRGAAVDILESHGLQAMLHFGQ